MEKNEIYSKVLTIISQQLNVSKDSVNQDSTLESLGADSLDRVEIVMKLEEEFSIEINDQDAESLSTISGVTEYISNLLNK